MEVPVHSHGEVVYYVLINVTLDEHQEILKKIWYKRKGQPVSRGTGNLFNLVQVFRKELFSKFMNVRPGSPGHA